MNPVVIAVITMLALSVARFPVVSSIIVAALAGGISAGMGVDKTLVSFNEGIQQGANIALSYALLGAFAAAIAKSGIPNWLCNHAVKRANNHDNAKVVRLMLLTLLALAACASQNIVPIHIAFIPLLVPPLLYLISQISLDRRLVACTLTFGLVATYLFIPVGFGAIYLDNILLGNLKLAGLDTQGISVMHAMSLPALGMVFGLMVAAFYSYRKPRTYDMASVEQLDGEVHQPKHGVIFAACAALAAAFAAQLFYDSMVFGALVGFCLLTLSGSMRWHETDGVFVDGIKMMANIGFIMIAASGFAEVLRDSGAINTLVESTSAWVGHSPHLASFIMLVVGLLITLGIGSSFSTVPIIATIYVPIALNLGFSPLAIAAMVGTAGVLGDAGSPASDSTLGPTAGLNADGQHDHIYDTVIPTFLHFNLPLLLFGWLATCVL